MLQNAISAFHPELHQTGRSLNIDRSQRGLSPHPDQTISQKVPQILLRRDPLSIQSPALLALIRPKDLHQIVGCSGSPPTVQVHQNTILFRQYIDPGDVSITSTTGSPVHNPNTPIAWIYSEPREKPLVPSTNLIHLGTKDRHFDLSGLSISRAFGQHTLNNQTNQGP